MRSLGICRKAIFYQIGAFLVSLMLMTPVVAADSEIKIGACFDLTGPYADVDMQKAFVDYIKYVNEKGGFKDAKGQTCKIKLIWKDGASKVPEALVAYKEFKSKGCVVHVYSSTSQNFALRSQAKKDKIPLSSQVVTNIVIEGDAGSWVYGQCPSREAIISGLDGIKMLWKEKRPPKIGFLAWDNLIGYDPVPFGKRYVKELGFELGPSEFFGMDALDITPQLTRLHAAKCDYVIFLIAGGQEAIIYKNKYRLGFHKDLKFVHCPPSTATGWSVTKKLNPKMYNGDLVINGHAVPADDTPGAKMVKEIQKKYHGSVDYDLWGDYLWGFHNVYGIVEGIKKAAQKVGGDQLTGEDVENYGFKDLKMKTQGLSHGLHYSKYHGVCTGFRLVERRDGKMNPISDWIPVTYLAPDHPDSPQWIKETAKKLAEMMKKKKKKK
ncbi:MAG: ABC transporter substrate-binding protein [Thermodesulfobacteriota bacterium]|nr:ABC transporter substrate-binding protein [Thermodesulfobacteriota bacterium]